MKNIKDKGFTKDKDNKVLISSAALNSDVKKEEIEKLVTDGIREVMTIEKNYDDLDLVYIFCR